MPRAAYKPKGTRVSITVPRDLEARIVRSPQAGAAMARTLGAVGAIADSTAPKASGRLAASRESEVQITPAGVVGLIGYLEFYAHMVHNGTSHSPANPWLLNAALSVLVTNRARPTRGRSFGSAA